MAMKLGAARVALVATLVVVLLGSLPERILAQKKVIVGGSQHWRFGFNFMQWAFQNGPFFQNDSLVFMYDPPNGTSFPHNVLLLKNYRSFMTCDLRNATLIGGPTQGGGQGLEVVLKKRKPYYFACGEHNGTHCTDGLMKFFVYPFQPCHH